MSTAIAAVNDCFSGRRFWVLNSYSKTAAIAADHLKIDINTHSETPEITITNLSARPCSPYGLIVTAALSPPNIAAV